MFGTVHLLPFEGIVHSGGEGRAGGVRGDWSRWKARCYKEMEMDANGDAQLTFSLFFVFSLGPQPKKLCLLKLGWVFLSLSV